MLQIKNGNIQVSRGESGSVELKIWNADGTPFIMPPVNKPSIKAIASIVDTEQRQFRYTYLFYCPIINTDLVRIKIPEDSAIMVYDESGSQDYFVGPYCDIDASQMSVITKIESYDEIEFIGIRTYGNQSLVFYNTNNIATAAFTVRAGLYDSIVLNKILNMHAAITKSGVTDYIPGGWSKFNSYEIYDAIDLTDLKDTLISAFRHDVIQLGKLNNAYFHIVLKQDGSLDIEPYEFSITIPLGYIDTNLEAKVYTYDFAAYIGEANEKMFTSDNLVYNEVFWKRELVTPHKFIVGDSNNA